MSGRVKNSENLLASLLKNIGSPVLFLFTFVGIIIISLVQLSKSIIQKLPTPSFSPQPLPFPPNRFLPPRFLKSFLVSFSLIIIILLTTYLFYHVFLRDLPSPTTLTLSHPDLSTKIMDNHGNLLYQIYSDENRSLIRLADLPPHLIQATIASEDKEFYRHHGVSLRGIVRALVSNLTNCRLNNHNCTLQGGSTITQQLVKNSLLSGEKTYTRKIREAILAIQLERHYTKDQILEFYFNYVPYGGTSYGIEEAARTYFGKSAADLTLSESALLAGLPVSPTILSPFGTNPHLAKNRQSQILDSMVSLKYITDSEALAAKSTPLTFRPQISGITAPHFVMYIKDYLVRRYGEDLVSRGGLEVITTLDLEKQRILEREISSELTKLTNLNVTNAAGLITEPSSGRILAMVGSRDFFDSQLDGQVNVTIQPRQPGSAIKPLTYALAFMNGLSPASTIEDSPVCFTSKGSPPYCPQNYDGRYHGKITLRQALASSYNIPAIKLLNGLGVNNLVNFAKQLGIKTWADSSRFGLALTLGGGEVTMLDMAEVYGVFANYGKRVPLNGVISVKSAAGQVLEDNTFSKEGSEAVLPPAVAYEINHILSDRLARSPAFGYNSLLNIPGRSVAVKTGTTNDLRDNWTFGYTPEVLVATWVGNNDNTPMSSVASGITGASPIWANTMKEILPLYTSTPFRPPENMIAIPMCSTTGRPYCPNSCSGKLQMEYFVPGSEPQVDCSLSGLIPPAAAFTSQ